MARPQKYSPETVAKVLTAVWGSPTEAAKRLGCSSSCVRGYMARHAVCQLAAEAAREERIDRCEHELDRLVMAGDGPSIRFLLATLGRKRGYTTRLDVCTCCGGVKVPSKAQPPHVVDPVLAARHSMRGQTVEQLDDRLRRRMVEPERADTAAVTVDAR